MKTIGRFVMGTAALAAWAGFAAGSLQEHARESGLDWMIGKWGDEASLGEVIKVSYAWEVGGHAVSMRYSSPERQGTGLIVKDTENDAVRMVAVDSEGGLSKGVWTIEDSHPVLRADYRSPEGETRSVTMIYQKVDEKKVKLRIFDGGAGLTGDPELEVTLVKLSS
ncbi:MAG TPA: hypothetical protein VMN36_17415 [Verrucomicrobiales bacterium]|nr:hypothetical protein [Verrucomicrobiales bacterium]